MNKSYNLQLTEEEIKAIQDYTGYMHARMNAIADLKYDKLKTLQQDGWYMNMTTEQLEQMILKFVQVYSAIYKAGSRDARGRLYRGTSQSEIKAIQNGKHVKSVISTSLEEDIAKNFTPYGKEAAILRIRTEKDLPYLYVEPLKEEGKRKEEEILILPFTRVKKIERTSDWNGYAYYDATLEKEELEEIPKKELETLKVQLIENYDYYKEQVEECIGLENSIEYVYMSLRQNDLSKEDKQYLSEQLDEKSSRYTELRRDIDEYQTQFSKMLKGMCKEKELEIDKQQEVEDEKIKAQQKEKQEEKRKQLETEMKSLEDEIQYEKLNIAETLEEYVRKMEANADKYQKIAEDLKVGYFMNPPFRILENIEAIKRKLKEDMTEEKEKEEKKQEKQENEEDKDDRTQLEKKYQKLLEERQQLVDIKQMMRSFPEYIKEHDRESFQQIKANLNTKIQEMITKERIGHLQIEKQQILQEKESKLQRLFYGTTLKEQKIANINAKMELEKRQAGTRNPENHVGIMMANLYDCSAQDLGGKFSPEMLEVIHAIRRNFDNLPNEEMLTRQAYQKVNSNYPAILGQKRLSKRKQINDYRQNTDRTKAEIYNTIYHKKPIQQEIQINALSKFEEGINHIKTVLERGKEQSHSIDRILEP